MSIVLLRNYLLTEEVTVERIPGQGPGCIVTRYGMVKSTVSGRIQALQCCKLLFGDKGEGTWIVGLLRDEILDSRAYEKEPG